MCRLPSANWVAAVEFISKRERGLRQAELGLEVQLKLKLEPEPELEIERELELKLKLEVEQEPEVKDDDMRELSTCQ